jgi:hypothetical protein
MLMAETLEVSSFGYELSDEDQQILRSIRPGELEVEQVVEKADVERSKALLSIGSLIASGYLRLVIIAYPWGTEFLLEPIREVTPRNSGKQN